MYFRFCDIYFYCSDKKSTRLDSLEMETDKRGMGSGERDLYFPVVTGTCYGTKTPPD